MLISFRWDSQEDTVIGLEGRGCIGTAVAVLAVGVLLATCAVVGEIPGHTHACNETFIVFTAILV
jgi:hypothetical protein